METPPRPVERKWRSQGWEEAHISIGGSEEFQGWGGWLDHHWKCGQISKMHIWIILCLRVTLVMHLMPGSYMRFPRPWLLLMSYVPCKCGFNFLLIFFIYFLFTLCNFHFWVLCFFHVFQYIKFICNNFRVIPQKMLSNHTCWAFLCLSLVALYLIGNYVFIYYCLIICDFL